MGKFDVLAIELYIIVMNVDDFWGRVEHQIKAHKISRKEFAEYINVPYSTFKSWLYYKRSTEVGTAYDIATALGVSVEYLVTGAEGKNEKERLKQTETRKSAGAEIKKLIGKLQEETEKL